ncbi:MAG TPA: glycoside hydrolase family 3 N-terminal domain-containing protein, partial [Pyrinomonadaceae bacterium]|nr:glycoside hydrolase family 3 N-terminal domain-containing protein [Pyrinomonadaceae bacterium]
MKSTDKVGQLFFPGIPGPELDSATRELLDEVRPGGVCLFTRNVREAGQTRELLDGLRSFLPETPFLSLDQEGGLVDRLRRVITPMPAPAKLRSPEDAAHLGTLIASAVRVLGFNMDFAPVVDVIDESRAGRVNGIQTRNFGSSREDVVEYAAAFLSSLEAGGILGCIKHFPGLGASAVDSHEELPRVEIEPEELESVDLYPYTRLLSRFEKLSVMVGHAAYPNSGPSLQETDQNGKLLPSSLSP